MDQDRSEGKIKDVTGRIKRQAGEWTGDKDLESEGAADQAEGKVQNTVGKMKDKGREALRDLDKKVNKDKAA